MTQCYIEKSAAADKSDYEKIGKYTKSEISSEDLYIFNVHLCNNDVDRDFEKFSLSALQEMKILFEGKTGISDHSMKSSDQIARIFETSVERQEGKFTVDGEPFYYLKAKAYMLKNADNDNIIKQIEAGIKKEVSVSCSMDERVCSICGADTKKSRCKHIPGKTYGSKLCCHILSKASDAYEWSFVAVPAQREAGVTKSFHIKGDSDMNNFIEKMKNSNEDITLSKSQSRELADYICTLEEDAKLGGEYKKSLAKEVTKFFCDALPQFDAKLFAPLTSIMTTDELTAFRDGFKKSKKSAVKPQLLNADSKTSDVNNSQFRI